MVCEDCRSNISSIGDDFFFSGNVLSTLSYNQCTLITARCLIWAEEAQCQRGRVELQCGIHWPGTGMIQLTVFTLAGMALSQRKILCSFVSIVPGDCHAFKQADYEILSILTLGWGWLPWPMYSCGYCNNINKCASCFDQVYSWNVISSVTVKNTLVRKNEACSCWLVFFFDIDRLNLPRTFHFYMEAWETTADTLPWGHWKVLFKRVVCSVLFPLLPTAVRLGLISVLRSQLLWLGLSYRL